MPETKSKDKNSFSKKTKNTENKGKTSNAKKEINDKYFNKTEIVNTENTCIPTNFDCNQCSFDF